MSDSIQGGCLCGSVRYESTAELGAAFVCHCTDCQKQTGSAFSVIVGVPAESFEISGDSVGVFDTTGDKSGKAVHRYFCNQCGSPLYSVAEVAPDSVFIKAGTLDDTSGINPENHVWTESAQDWAASYHS